MKCFLNASHLLRLSIDKESLINQFKKQRSKYQDHRQTHKYLLVIHATLEVQISLCLIFKAVHLQLSTSHNKTINRMLKEDQHHLITSIHLMLNNRDTIVITRSYLPFRMLVIRLCLIQHQQVHYQTYKVNCKLYISKKK